MLNKQTNKMPSRLIPERQNDDYLDSSDDELPEFALPLPDVIYLESDEDSDEEIEDHVDERDNESDQDPYVVNHVEYEDFELDEDSDVEDHDEDNDEQARPNVCGDVCRSSFEFSSDEDFDLSDFSVTSSSSEDDQQPKNILQRELEEIKNKNSASISVQLKDGNLFEWQAAIRGPAGTPYEGGTFKLDLKFPRNYPREAPSVNFNTKIYHCNVGSDGQIKMDVLTEEVEELPASTALRFLLVIEHLLIKCDPHECMRKEIAAQYVNDREEHDRICREWTEKYATEEAEMK